MTNLQSKKASLLQQLSELDDKIAEQQCTALIEEAFTHVQEARRLVKEADELDRAAKREQDEARRLARQERKARLEIELIAAEQTYRGCAHDALDFYHKTHPERALKPAEVLFLDDPASSPVQLSEAVYRQLSDHHSARIAEARHTLGALRRELAGI